MTRETKAGLVVSCSFLSLVGVVLLNKLREPPSQPTEETQTIAMVQEKSANSPDTRSPTPKGELVASRSGPEKSSLPKSDPPGPFPPIRPAGFVELTGDPSKPPPPPGSEGKSTDNPPSTPTPEESAPPTPELPPGLPAPASPTSIKAPENPPAPSPPPPVGEALPTPEPAPVTPVPPEQPLPPPTPPGGREVPLSNVTPEPTVSPTPAPAPGPPPPVPGISGTLEPPAPPTAPAITDPPVEPRIEPAPATVETPPPPPPASSQEFSPVSPMPPRMGTTPETPPPAPPTTTLPIPEPAPGKVELPKPEEMQVAPPPAPATPPVAAHLPPLAQPEPPIPAVSPGENVVLAPTPIKAPSVTPPEEPPPPLAPVPVPEVQVQPEPAPRNDIPPATTPPIVARNPVPDNRVALGGQPVVESYDEEEYVVESGDTFASISKKKYLTDKYGEALRLYNRFDALLNDNAKFATGTPQPGQILFVPSQHVLEKRYRDAISGLKPVDAGTGVIEAPVVAATPSPERKAVATATTVNYQVPAQGQTMLDISRLTLGNANRWQEVYHLNPQFAPEARVPGGAVLKLPGDARVPSTSP